MSMSMSMNHDCHDHGVVRSRASMDLPCMVRMIDDLRRWRKRARKNTALDSTRRGRRLSRSRPSRSCSRPSLPSAHCHAKPAADWRLPFAVASACYLIAAALTGVPVEWLLPAQTLSRAEINLASAAFDQPPLVPEGVPVHLAARVLDEERRFPLLVSPAPGASNETTSLESLAQWAQENRPLLRRWLDAYGAVLFRGFAGQGAKQFEHVASAFSVELERAYLGTSPRASVDASEFVNTASDFPAWMVVPFHCEMSFLPKPPSHIFFYAAQIDSAMWGGETPLVDMRAVAREMSPEVAAAFREGGVRYIRHYPDAASSHPADTLDASRIKPWQDLFRHLPEVAASASNASADAAAAARAAVETESVRQGLTPSWDSRGGLKLTNEAPAFREHPATGLQTWFNHLGVIHSSASADEYAHAAVHLRSLKYVAIAYAFYALDALSHVLLGPESIGMHVTHFGGAPISRAHVWHVRRLVWKHMLVSPWQQGDLIMMDNFRIAHARMPHKDVPRKLWVAWSRHVD